MSDEIKWTAGAYAAVAAVAIVLLLAIAIYLFLNKMPWLPLRRLRPGTWGGYEVFIAFCIFYGLPSFIMAVLIQIGFFEALLGPLPQIDPPAPELQPYWLRGGMIASPLIVAAVLGLFFAALYLRSGTRPRQYGLSWSRWPANVGLGLAAFLVATPVVLGLHALVTLGQPDDQPFRRMAREMADWEWGFFAFQVIAGGPILEEVLFRGILLGWLRRASLGGHIVVGVMMIVAAVAAAPPGDSPSVWEYVVPGLFAAGCASVYFLLMYRLARRFDLSAAEVRQWRLAPADIPEAGDGIATEKTVTKIRQIRAADETCRSDWARQNAALAVVGSSMAFAIFHAGTWPAPVALLPLALVLGWLAMRTQSLLGPIVLHGLFNLVSTIVLYGTS